MKNLKSLCDDIPAEVATYAETHGESRRRFCSWLEADGEDVIQRIFAFRHRARKDTEITECIRKHSTGPSVVKNIYYNGMAGYQIMFERKDKYVSSCGYPFLVFAKEDFDTWYDSAGWKECNVDSVILNLKALEDTRYKYCGFAGNGADLMRHLRDYDVDPKGVELFAKWGLKVQPSLIDKAKKDGQFRRFIFDNRHAVFLYGALATEYAYKHKVSIEEARRITKKERDIKVFMGRAVPEVRGTTINRIKLDEYIKKSKCEYAPYNDYLKAIKYLKLNLDDTKNLYPNDFARMHDLRIAEYSSAYAKAEKAERKKLEKKFTQEADKAREIAEYSDGEYVVIIPRQISELVAEGECLHHCVGRMGYDKKMADGKSLIAFLRSLHNVNTPLVTIEFDKSTLTVRQAYGDHDTKPSDDARAFIETWEERVRERYNDLRTSANCGTK